MPLSNEDNESIIGQDSEVSEMRSYISLFVESFNELHEAAVQHAKKLGQNIVYHHDYPSMSYHSSGLPHFSKLGYYRTTDTPRDYVSSVRPSGLLAVMVGHQPPAVSLPKSVELAEFLRTHAIGKRLNLRHHKGSSGAPDWRVNQLVGDAVERYLHLYGIDAPIDPQRRSRIVLPLIRGTLLQNFGLRLVVPITMTHFEVDHYKLSDRAYIMRIPKKLQLARAKMNTLGSGAVDLVVGAATHALVSKDWHLTVENIDDVSRSLSQSSPNVIDEIDGFFAALRITMGISTGYAQVLWVPDTWSLGYFCDLPPVYGFTIRRYPDHYDNYGWTHQGSIVGRTQLHEVRRVYNAVIANNSEGMRLALRRLNACLTRTDASDAILDATIGLELLLGDDENQSLSYKLRLRAGALAGLRSDPTQPADEIVAKVKRLYEVRSSIVHGRRKKVTRKVTDSVDTSHAADRLLGSDLLRFVIEVLLAHPAYQIPSKIDEDLLLRITKFAVHQNPIDIN